MRKRNAPWLPTELGMTIVELMIVLTIIAAIMGVIAYNVSDVLVGSNHKLARIEVDRLTELVQTHYLLSTPRRYPDALEEMTGGAHPVTEKIPLDPWGNEYRYRRTGDSFEVSSAGPDGQPDTPDDIRAD